MSDQFYTPGWTDDPVEVEVIASQQPFPVFGDTPAGQADIALPQTCYFWKIHESVTGSPMPNYNQLSVGSCVGFGAVAAIEMTMINEIFRKEPEEYLLRKLPMPDQESKSAKDDWVEVTVRLGRGQLNFLSSMDASPEEYINNMIFLNMIRRDAVNWD